LNIERNKDISFYLKNKRILNNNNFIKFFISDYFFSKLTEQNDVLSNKRVLSEFSRKNIMFKFIRKS
jgi:hypothetical protein